MKMAYAVIELLSLNLALNPTLCKIDIICCPFFSRLIFVCRYVSKNFIVYIKRTERNKTCNKNLPCSFYEFRLLFYAYLQRIKHKQHEKCTGNGAKRLGKAGNIPKILQGYWNKNQDK